MILDTNINIRCKKELKEDLKELAASKNRSLSDYVNLALSELVKSNKEIKE